MGRQRATWAAYASFSRMLASSPAHPSADALSTRSGRLLLSRYRQVFHAAAALGPHRLGIELHELENVVWHVCAHMQSEFLRGRRPDRIVVRPSAGRELFGQRAGLLGGQRPFHELARGLLDLRDRLAADIRANEGLVADAFDRLLLDHLDERSRRRLSELRIDRAEHGMLAHHDLVGGERYQRAAGHRIMGHEYGYLCLVGAEG